MNRKPNSSVCYLPRLRVHARLGRNFAGRGRKTGGSTVGGATIGNGRNDSENFSRTWVKVCAHNQPVYQVLMHVEQRNGQLRKRQKLISLPF